jgi:hypothetical protein
MQIAAQVHPLHLRALKSFFDIVGSVLGCGLICCDAKDAVLFVYIESCSPGPSNSVSFSAAMSANFMMTCANVRTASLQERQLP